MDIIFKKISELKKYENNPRDNSEAIKEVADSIKKFGFRVPIIIDADNTIICGHTRYEACRYLKINEVPCIMVNDLSEEQVKAFRLADNKVSEFSLWDYEKLKAEIEGNSYLMELSSLDELDITNDDFVKDTEITKEKKIKVCKCPKCGKLIK